MSFTAFCTIMLVCIYLALIAANMERCSTIVWACSVSLFVILLIRILILLIEEVRL